MESGQCAVCGILARKFCSRCHLVYYCGRDHQRQHWPTHRASCRLFKVEHNESLGHYLVATRDLLEREVLLRETPLLRGPYLLTLPVCVSCYESLPAKCVPCVHCGWPMCSVGCADSPDHVPECRIITNTRKEKVTINSAKHDNLLYNSVMVLRALFLRDADPVRWHKLLSFESHCHLIRESYIHQAICVSITKTLHSFFKFTAFSKEEILLVSGILTVNGFGSSKIGSFSIYEWASLLEHSCHANCFYTTNKTGELVVRTAKHIGHGEHLSIGYVDALKSREARRKHLRAGKFFWCRCPRCVDPTDMGTFFSALRCPQPGCNGLCVPNSEWLKLEPPDDMEEPAWCCHHCQQLLPIVQVQQQLAKADNDFKTVNQSDVQQCIEFLRRQEAAAQLGPDHFYMTEMRLQVANRLGLCVGGIEALPEELLHMKEKFCRHLLKLIDALCPAEHCTRGCLLLGVLTSIIETERRCGIFNFTDPTSKEEKRKLILETIDLLRYEPEDDVYGRILMKLKASLFLLDKMDDLVGRLKKLKFN